MSITHIGSLPELDRILSKSKEKLSVIDFHATWCGPCHMIAPTFEALSKKYSNVNFLKCDVDAARDVASRYSVSAMPTFIFLKGSTKIDQVRGADRNALESTLRKHATSSTATFTGTGRTLGGDPAPKNVVGGVKDSVSQATSKATAKVANLDPGVRVFLGLLGAYLVFWYLSS